MNAYEIKLGVKDSEGLTDIASNSVELNNSPPTASFSISPTAGTTSTIFTFDANGCTDAEDEASDLQVRWDWHNDGDWDDGYMTDKTITHQFNTIKDHSVLLEVMDTNGLTDTLSLTVDVSLGCAAIITEDATLSEDLNCTEYENEVLLINSSNVTLDLNSYTINNASQNREKYGIDIRDADNVTIKNGTLDGFLYGITISNSNNITLENVTIRNMDIFHSDTSVVGISMEKSSNVNVKSCQFKLPSKVHKEAINCYESSFTIEDCEFIGGAVGITYSYTPSCEPGSSNCNNVGTVTNNTFTDVVISGVLVSCTNNAVIQGNEFIRNEIAIGTHPPTSGSITNLVIEDNFIHDGFQGIYFLGVSGALINNNTILNNGFSGINLNQDHDCSVGIFNNACFYSTNNIISNNTVTHNGADLMHHELCIGNTWTNNTCQTKEGDEIPECTD